MHRPNPARFEVDTDEFGAAKMGAQSDKLTRGIVHARERLPAAFVRPPYMFE